MKNIFLVLFIVSANTLCAARSYGADNFGDFDVHYQLGNEYNKRGMVDDAIREYKKAAEINGISPKLYNNLGVAYGSDAKPDRQRQAREQQRQQLHRR